MSKFLNTTYRDSVEKVTGFYNDLINNNFYKFNDKKPVICTYYNINKNYSSLDPGSKLYMDYNGSQTPLRFNRIFDMIIYGFQRIELNTDNGEFGLEANNIEGECYILPGTIIPTEGDYFEINHIKDSSWLFIVKDVQQDTLDNGSNVYKISYKMETIDKSFIIGNIVYNFRCIEDIEGTNISKIVRCEDYDIAVVMDKKVIMLKKYFIELFYNKSVQTFIYHDLTDIGIYDPFMIEFLIRNNILSNGNDGYIHVQHQIPVISTFGLEYDKTFFREFEKKNKDSLILSNYKTSVEIIKSYGTTFSSRYETFYKTNFNQIYGYNICCLDEDLLSRILDNNIVENIIEINVRSELWKNIFIKYFNNGTLTLEEIKSIKDIDFSDSIQAFYMIPLLIFCLEKFIENTLK